MKRIIAGLIFIVAIMCSCSKNSMTSTESKTENTMSTDTIPYSSNLISGDSFSVSESSDAFSYTGDEPSSWNELKELVQESVKEQTLPEIAMRDIPGVIVVHGEYETDMPPINNDILLAKVLIYTDICKVISDNENTDRAEWLRHIRYSSDVIREFEPEKYREIAFFRQTGEGQYYTVKKVVNGGYQYIFYSRIRDPNDAGQLSKDLTNVYHINSIYMEKTLDIAAFENIVLGSTLDEVIAVDNAALPQKLFAGTYLNAFGEPKQTIMSKHLLTDGLLMIKYDYRDGAYVVTEKRFSSDFVFDMSQEAEVGESFAPRVCSILPQDYPPAQ